jgi:zinc protease
MADRYALDNGLTVVFEEEHAAKVAAFQVWVNVGSADEREDQAGLAHLHEHMLFKGTARYGPGEIAHTIEALGGEINAWTSFDQTVYHIVIASPFAKEGLAVLGDAVRSSTFDAGELSREIEVVCEEIKRSQDAPSRRASRDLFSTAFTVHPYRRPVIGWEETVRSFSRDKVLEFFERHYAPSNMVLSVAGDLKPEQLRSWVEEIFGGDWGRKYAGAMKRPVEPPSSAQRILLRKDDVKEAYVNLGFLTPSALHPDAPALDVLAMILGQGDAARLPLQVKRKRPLVNEIYAYSYTPKDAGLFMASMTVPAERVADALAETTKVLSQVTREPPSVDELSTVQALVETDAIYQRETVQGLARKMGYFQTALGSIDEEARYYEKVARLTPEDLHRVAQRYFNFDAAVLTALLPPESQLSEADAKQILSRSSKEEDGANYSRKSKRPSLGGIHVTSPLSEHSRPGELHIETLPSGARILVREESAVPLFAIRAAFLGGTRFETVSDNGLTPLLARMLNRGTPERDAEEISKLVDELGGTLIGIGGRNSMSLRGEFLSKHFDEATELFAQCLLTPSFPEQDFEREQRLLIQDILTREDKPSGLAFDLFAQTLFEKHPYRLSTLGEKDSVEKLTPAALAAHHAQYMDPSQLVLCVVGDVKTDEVLKRAHSYFGKGRGKAAPPVRIPAEQKPTAPRSRKKTLQRAQSHLVYGFLGLTVSDPQRRALEVLSMVLSGQGGRLFRELRDKRSMAYSVYSFAVEGVDPGSFSIYIATSPEKTDAALEGIREELRKIREEPVTAAELDRAKRHLIGSHEIGLQRNSARAALLALDACYGLGGENFFHYQRQVEAVTADDVLAIARRIIDFDASALALVGP